MAERFMLDINGVSKTFNPGTTDAKLALNKLSLRLKEGEFASIIGANGAGKSTLFNAICGSFLCDEGSISLDGEDITLQPEHKRSEKIGRLFQDPLRGTAPNMTIEENLALAAGTGKWFSRTSRAQREEYREKLRLLNMGLEDRMKQNVGLLSGGQRQALTLMMATINVPKLLLLDEHTAALDPAAAEKVLELTERIVGENGLTCLMVTHNMSSALKLGSRTIMMDGGRIIMDLCGHERKGMTVDNLTAAFRKGTGRSLDNDRMLLS